MSTKFTMKEIYRDDRAVGFQFYANGVFCGNLFMDKAAIDDFKKQAGL